MTAPAVSPATIRFWKITTKMIRGTVIVTLPNDDPGNAAIRRVLLEWAGEQPSVHAFTSLGQHRYLSLLASLAACAHAGGDDAACLAYAQRVLAHDPCREDAHRLVMRCHVWRGERAQALHQYRVCVDLLRAAFGTTPEPATVALFEQVRRDPGSV